MTQEMHDDQHEAEFDHLRCDYKAAVEVWITAIRAEEELASEPDNVAEIDAWDNAHFLAEDGRREAEAAKAAYTNALRSHFFDID